MEKYLKVLNISFKKFLFCYNFKSDVYFYKISLNRSEKA